ncbi:hypothetical protein [Candidatus Absconditicoccus praedator]|uniref:hypothetical protein n=1 Tax=Candidatus Absconditicoccus praedator TaxID=2735562 RepID=UPI001E5CB5B2|nr:hypothetical protein [Candidatus Absconditicoccus praedator]UFX82945.1 hypothetical protein HLG78_02315 [Candidatus Absconditicoccus praedator]
MNQHEQVINVMEKAGGFATLGFLYKNVDVSKWSTKTPFASIRRIVQNEKFFVKIKPGLWALKDYIKNLPVEVYPDEEISSEKKNEFDHTYYQGLLVETGNFKQYDTFTPSQDKNKKYLGKTLYNSTSMDEIFNFTHSEILRYARTVDVVWFNQRRMPSAFFEIEHSTDMKNSLGKFVELQDFYSHFFIVADISRKSEYEDKIKLSTFKDIKDRVKFADYNKVAEWHEHSYKLSNNEIEKIF